MLDISKIRKQFPILSRKVNGQDLVYFDNGATTQKPQAVIDSESNYYQNENSNVHRGVHFLSGLATDKFEETRNTIQAFIGAKHSHEIIFTKGTTDSINLVANGFRTLFKKGDEIIITELEHHSNIVPWQMCCEQSEATLKVIPLLDNGELDMNEFNNLLSESTKLVAVSHISNALGTINDIEEIIEKSHKIGAKVLIDGAQAASHVSINMQELNADFYCFSSHKMFGPTGVGVLYGKEEILNELSPYQGGGEMIKEVSFSGTTYAELPHKFEAGTPNIAGVIAFKSAIDFITNLGVETIAKYEDELLQYVTSEILKIEGVKIYGTAKNKSAILSFNIEGLHPYDIGMIVDKMGIAIRTGHHCAQPIMEKFNIPGTARISLAIYNTKEEIDLCINAIKKAKLMLS
ncbi:MAG: cysteine desulfurase [Flavobacteriales bacterium]|jgi:cysteine desulfurase/selenocysteine lyase|nr:cysteine desulfurase [Flavobacteriales bacterium]MBT6013223.1 cysteine desulfurase [Flavobacteriales bacterium]MBT7480884.1 cysteine desulfurase [Flavobacteriales bacterium]